MSDDDQNGVPPGTPPAPIVAPPIGSAATRPGASPLTSPPSGSAAAPPPYGSPPPGYGPPDARAQNGGRPGYGPTPYPGQVGWAPPPRPGLIPLAPLTFGTILGAPYRLFRKNPRPTFGMSLLIQGGVSLISIVVIGLVSWASLSRVDFATSTEEENELLAGAFGTILLSSAIPIAIAILATGVMQGIIVLEVSRQTLGEKLTFASLWARGKGRVWAVAGYSLLLAVAIGVVVVIVVVIAIVPFAFGGAGIAVGIVLTIVLYLGLLAGVLWLTTKLAFVPSAIVLERLGVFPAIARSWTLTRQAFWRTLGILVLVAVILGIASQVISIPVTFVGTLGAGVFAPTGDETALIATVVIVYVLFGIATLVISAISLVVQSATSALLYIDQRVRKEGLDLDLLRFVEARQSGATGLRDPYETAASRPAL